MLKALADGETDPVALVALADQRLRATPAQLVDALGACAELNPVYRRLLTLKLAPPKCLRTPKCLRVLVAGSKITQGRRVE